MGLPVAAVVKRTFDATDTRNADATDTRNAGEQFLNRITCRVAARPSVTAGSPYR
jgi:hypothetical protein